MKISKLLGFILAFTMMLTISVSAVEYGEEYQNQPTKIYSQKFSDVPKTHWAFNYIAEMTERGVLNGYPGGKFYPENNITRAEFAKIMTVASGMSIDMSDTDTIYDDISDDDWFAPYVRCAQDYLNGFGSGSGLYFRPNQLAVREDIVVAIVKLKGYSTFGADVSMLSTMFSDSSSISMLAKKYVAIAIERGIISGYEDGTFRGQSSISRAEAAAILWRAFQYGDDNKEFDYVSTPQPTNIPAIEATEKPTIEPTLVPTLRPTETPTPRPTNTPIPTPTPEPTATPTPTPKPKGWDVYTITDWYGDEYDTWDYITHDTNNDIIYIYDEDKNVINTYNMRDDKLNEYINLNNIYRMCDTSEWVFEDPGTGSGNYYKNFKIGTRSGCGGIYYDNYTKRLHIDLISEAQSDIGGLSDIYGINEFSIYIENSQWIDCQYAAYQFKGSCEYGFFQNYLLTNYSNDTTINFYNEQPASSDIIVSGNSAYILSNTGRHSNPGVMYESALYKIDISDMQWVSIRDVGTVYRHAWNSSNFYAWQDDKIVKCDLNGNLSILLNLDDIEIHDFKPIDEYTGYSSQKFIVSEDERYIMVPMHNSLRIIRKR